MTTPPDAASPDPERDALYDAYLDACLSGTAEDPAVFCERHGVVAEELRARFEALHRMVPVARSGDDAGPNGPSNGGADLPFARLGDYRLLERLDGGGMGTVYLAKQESLDRVVALKVMHAELSASPSAVERFQREAKALARLKHPNIVAIHAVGEDHGVRYIAMDLVPGRTLDDLLAESAAHGESLAPHRVLGWARDLARALASAHAAGVVHRDVKPSNVRITPDDRPLLLDFGIARDLASDQPALTRTFAGSPLYAAPEQLTGAEADLRVDVYGLGVTLYQCLTGRVPFAGGSMEQVLHRVLTEEVLPPRRLNPAVPRDAEIVVLHALEREPALRYATAEEFAADLDAVLDGRPISARAPGALGRAKRWCRRHPVFAAVSATIAALAIAASAIFLAERAASNAERRRRAGDQVLAARGLLAEYRHERDLVAALEQSTSQLRTAVENRYITAEEDATRDAKVEQVATARRAREQRFFGVLDKLNAAELLDQSAPGVREVRADLFLEKWREARASEDTAAAAFYRDLVLQYDVVGRHAKELRGIGTVSLRTNPSGAVVYRFDLREQVDVVPGGEGRTVPVPREGAARTVVPGTSTLRVIRAADGVEPDDVVTRVAGREVRDAYLVLDAGGAVERLDRLVSVDGAPVRSRSDLAALGALDRGEHDFVFERDGRTFTLRVPSLTSLGVRVGDPAECVAAGNVSVTIVRAGVLREVLLTRGIDARRTETPLVLAPDCVVGQTPIDALEIAEGAHLFVFECPGRPRVRLAIRATAATAVEYLIDVPPAAPPAPDDCVFVPSGAADGGGVWIMDHEVTSAEYLVFLNDREVLARIDAATEPMLFPRSPENRRDGGAWPLQVDETYGLPKHWPSEWPVLGVSWNDARDYAAWRTARERAAGRATVYRLPTFSEWIAAAGVSTGRLFSYGSRFHARWVKSCFARPSPGPEAVLSYPIDESPYGAFDMTGSAYEWVDGWWDESRGLRRLMGGSWAQGELWRFQIYGGDGAEPTAAREEYGFRLVVVPAGGDR